MVKLSERIQEADWKQEKHVPVIESPDAVKAGEVFDVKATLGKEIAPLLAKFRLGYELLWVNPRGTGQWAQPNASFFKPYNQWDDPKALADRAQADLDAGLKAVK